MNKDDLKRLLFTVLSCNEVHQDGEPTRYHVKYQHKGVVVIKDESGDISKPVQVTFYRFVDNPIDVGKKVKINFDLFNVTYRDYHIKETGQVRKLKYLEPKLTADTIQTDDDPEIPEPTDD